MAGVRAIDRIATPETLEVAEALNFQALERISNIIDEYQLPAHTVGFGVKGCVTWSTKPVRNYRDYKATDFGVAEFMRLGTGVDILRPNEDEACVLAGVADVVVATEKLTEFFPLVITTSGRNGVHVGERGKPIVHIEVDPIDVVDPTGAGDSFNAGVLAALASGATPVEAARNGARIAASGLLTVGARPS
jgi:sugar/nucleoside kinase (ribokinase family)